MAESEKKQGFIVFYDTMDALEEYTEAEVGSFIRAMEQFARYGVVPDFEDRGFRVLWKYVQQSLERGEAAYQKKCQQNRYNAYVSAEKRKYRRDHPGLGEAKEGKDYLAFEEWAEQIDEATASECKRPQATATEAELTETGEGAKTGAGAEAKTETAFLNNNSFGSVNAKGDTGGTSPAALQAAWKDAKKAGENTKAFEIVNALFRLGYNIDFATGELSKR